MSVRNILMQGRPLSMALAMLMAFLFARVATAECNAYSCNDVRITALYTRADGSAYVQTSGTVTNLNCSLVGGLYMTLPTASTRFKEIYASLLAYQLTDRLITIRIDEGSTGCTVAYLFVP